MTQENTGSYKKEESDYKDYKNVVHFLESQSIFHEPKYLDEIRCRLQMRTAPEQVIIVAGTNGKGTTSATIAALLQASGKHIGFFSSPHLVSTTERIKYDGSNISEDNFCAVFETVKEIIGSDAKLSYFEWLTLMAEYYFFEIKQVDYAVFEVGMGGILDATNIIPHKFCVITHLALDHCDILGNLLEEIAINKFGIITPESVVFHTKFPTANIEKIAREYAKKYSAKLVEACDFKMTVDAGGNTRGYPIFFVETPHGRFRMNLAGQRAAENTALALTFFNYFLNNVENDNKNICVPKILKIQEENENIEGQNKIGKKNLEEYKQTISQIKWAGRMQLVQYKGQDVFLSGDHNPDGIQSLIDLLQYYRFSRIHFVVGIGATKDHHKMLEKLFAVPNSRIYLTETTVHTLPIDQYDSADLKRAVFASSNQKDVLDMAVNQVKIANREQPEYHVNDIEKDMVVVTGSLYLVGEILKIIGEQLNNSI